MPNEIQLHDKTFVPYIGADQLESAIEKTAAQLSEHYKDKQPLFVVVLNGAFMFAAELLKRCNIKAEVVFVRVASYSGTQSSGDVREILGLTSPIEHRDVILIEDIIDTGHTIAKLFETLLPKNPKSIKVASLLFKKLAYEKAYPIDYYALEIENKFVVGYGLDYNELGRNIPSIYVLKS